MAEAASAVPDDSVQRLMPEDALEAALSVPVGEGGGALSPLSGAYLLVVLSEPLSEAHKTRMVQKLRQGNLESYFFLLPSTTMYLPAFAENS